jgi:hypothetical protein
MRSSRRTFLMNSPSAGILSHCKTVIVK